MSTKLTPPDMEQCQAEKSNDVNFMTLGGRREMKRCTEKPTVIVKETVPGKDGQCGSMTLCADCLVVFLNRVPQWAEDKKLGILDWDGDPSK